MMSAESILCDSLLPLEYVQMQLEDKDSHVAKNKTCAINGKEDEC